MGNSSLKMKSASRLYAVQALFQMEAIDQDLEEIKAEFQNFRIGAEFDGILYNEADIKFFKDIVDSAVKNQSQIDQMTDKALAKNWPIDRIDPTIRALFRSGTAELFLGKTPVAVEGCNFARFHVLDVWRLCRLLQSSLTVGVSIADVCFP